MSNFKHERIKGSLTLLDRWHGHPARLREITSSHATLTFLVFIDGATMLTHNLVIYCQGPVELRCPMELRENQFTLEIANDLFALVDPKNDVLITCENVEVKENVKLA